MSDHVLFADIAAYCHCMSRDAFRRRQPPSLEAAASHPQLKHQQTNAEQQHVGWPVDGAGGKRGERAVRTDLASRADWKTSAARRRPSSVGSKDAEGCVLASILAGVTVASAGKGGNATVDVTIDAIDVTIGATAPARS